MKRWKAVREVIERGKRFVVGAHINPDGDAVGSTIALLRLLAAMGKIANAFVPSPVPPVYHFLGGWRKLRVYRKTDDRLISRADAAFFLDASTTDRLGGLYRAVTDLGLKRICIDHHQHNSVGSEIKVIDTGACSTSELVYDLYAACGKEVDYHSAEALYTGIHTDTVSFNFLGADARMHEIAADLLRRGVDAKRTWTAIYGNDTPRLLKLCGLVLSGLHTADRGRIAWLTIRMKDWRRMRVDPRDTEAFTRYPLTIHGVGVIALFCEEGKRRVRVSLRALDRTDVGRIAVSLGGGGHYTSAGVTMMEPLDKVIRKVLSRLCGKNGCKDVVRA